MKRNLQPAIVAVVIASALSGCISFPPPFDANPHVVVEYKNATLLPNSTEAWFVKIVSQKRTKPLKKWDGIPPFISSHWTTYESTEWAKVFFCSSEINTGAKRVIREWPRNLCVPVHFDWFRVSRPLRSAVFSCDGPIVVMNLDSLEWRYLDFSRYPYSMPGQSPDISPDEMEFVLALSPNSAPIEQKPQDFGVVISDFEGHMRSFMTKEMVYGVRWLQKSNLIRIAYKNRCVTVKPTDFSVVEEKDMHWIHCVADLPRGEEKSPLDDQYNSRSINLGTPGSYKGSFSSSKAVTLW